MKVLGHVRQRGAVVSTDETRLNQIRTDRERKKEIVAMEKRIARLERRIEELEGKLSG